MSIKKNLQLLFLSILFFMTTNLFSDNKTTTSETEQNIKRIKEIWESVDQQRGNIKLPNGVATLNVPNDFYYLNTADSEKILVEIWQNPKEVSDKTLGMLFPSNSTPLDPKSWAVTIEYIEDGYVSDDNAEDINYDDLLLTMKKKTKELNKIRIEKGYPSIELIGWAEKPYYDQESHKLHWAKEIKFGKDSTNTLNYNIRILGRKGVLVLNFIANIEQKELINTKIDTVLKLANFNNGLKYDDFNPDIDTVAAYGIGALVAGKFAAKAGLFATALIFLKKFGLFILIGLGTLISRFFKRKK